MACEFLLCHCKLRSKPVLHPLLDRAEISAQPRAHREHSGANRLAPESQEAQGLSQKPSCFLSCDKKKGRKGDGAVSHIVMLEMAESHRSQWGIRRHLCYVLLGSLSPSKQP